MWDQSHGAEWQRGGVESSPLADSKGNRMLKVLLGGKPAASDSSLCWWWGRRRRWRSALFVEKLPLSAIGSDIKYWNNKVTTTPRVRKLFDNQFLLFWRHFKETSPIQMLRVFLSDGEAKGSNCNMKPWEISGCMTSFLVHLQVTIYVCSFIFPSPTDPLIVGWPLCVENLDW